MQLLPCLVLNLGTDKRPGPGPDDWRGLAGPYWVTFKKKKRFPLVESCYINNLFSRWGSVHSMHLCFFFFAHTFRIMCKAPVQRWRWAVLMAAPLWSPETGWAPNRHLEMLENRIFYSKKKKKCLCLPADGAWRVLSWGSHRLFLQDVWLLCEGGCVWQHREDSPESPGIMGLLLSCRVKEGKWSCTKKRLFVTTCCSSWRAALTWNNRHDLRLTATFGRRSSVDLCCPGVRWCLSRRRRCWGSRRFRRTPCFWVTCRSSWGPCCSRAEVRNTSSPLLRFVHVSFEKQNVLEGKMCLNRIHGYYKGPKVTNSNTWMQH